MDSVLESKKMSINDTLVRMINCVNSDQLADFYKLADDYANTFARGSNTGYRIKNAIRSKPPKLLSLNEMSSNLKKLLMQSHAGDDSVYVNPAVEKLISNLMFEWSNRKVYQYHNLSPRCKILFHGPTGNGKTTIARFIAKKSNLPFVEIKAEEVIDSHLGSTGSNIYNIFNSLTEPCVLFWDEIDSIGCKRSPSNEGAASHENDRMTNSLLVNLDKLSKDIIFIGATNRRDILDSAFVRRFDIQFELTAPSKLEKEKFAAELIHYYKINSPIPELDTAQSYSEVKGLVVAIARAYVNSLIESPIELPDVPVSDTTEL